MPRYYPIYLNLTGKFCVVVGGGAVAARKVAGLLEAGARVRVISLEFAPDLKARAEAGEIEAIPAPYAIAFLRDTENGGNENSTGDRGRDRSLAQLVFAATNRRDVNAQVVADAQALGIPVSAADAPEEGDFITPSVVRRGELCLSVSTGGSHPLLASRIAEELANRFGPEYGGFVELLGQMRTYIKERTANMELRRAALARLIEPDAEAELRECLRNDGLPAARVRAEVFAETVLKQS